MNLHSRLLLVSTLAGAALFSTPAAAQQIGNGTVTIANLYVPTVNLTTTPATYTANLGSTFQVLGTGAFASATGLTGVQNGTIVFSNVVGGTLAQNAPNFFSFDDGVGGRFNFTPLSAITRTFNVTPGLSSSISLLLLGNTVNTTRAFTPTPTSLTLSFNSTGGSAFSSSATLSIPPEGVAAVPEPASWAMMIMGTGLIGGAFRRRRKAIVRFGGYKIA